LNGAWKTKRRPNPPGLQVEGKDAFDTALLSVDMADQSPSKFAFQWKTELRLYTDLNKSVANGAADRGKLAPGIPCGRAEGAVTVLSGQPGWIEAAAERT